MRICGLQKTTLLDFPDHIACTVFTSGCDFRCPFCYNPDLVLGKTGREDISEQGFFEFLESRGGFLDGVVVCGGEPTLQPDIAEFTRRVRGSGFAVKLDTNGSRPKVLADLLEEGLLQYVSLDVKSVLDNEHYSQACGLEDFNNISEIRDSINLLFTSNVNFEFRTTVVPTLHDKDILLQIARELQELAERTGSLGKAIWVLQTFEPRGCLDPAFDKLDPFSENEMAGFLDAVEKEFPNIKLRGVA